MALPQPSGTVLKFEGFARNLHRNCAAVYKSVHSGHRPLRNGVCAWPQPYRNLLPKKIRPCKKFAHLLAGRLVATLFLRCTPHFLVSSCFYDLSPHRSYDLTLPQHLVSLHRSGYPLNTLAECRAPPHCEALISIPSTPT